MDLPPLFNAQFFDDDGTPLSLGQLQTLVSGTETDQTTYQDQAGATPNANPIVLDSRGECLLWLDPALTYRLRLKREDLTTVWTRDNIVAPGSGAIVQADLDALTSDDIAHTTGTSTTWYSGADVGAGLDSIITRLDAPPASSVTITDGGGYLTATNVEAALQEFGAVMNPSLSGNSSRLLTNNGVVTQWIERSSIFNVTYPNTAYAEDDTFTLAANTTSVTVWAESAATGTTGSTGALEIYAGGTLLATLKINGTNLGFGDTGGSSMTDGASATFPIASNATSIKFVKSSGTPTVSFTLQAYVTHE